MLRYLSLALALLVAAPAVAQMPAALLTTSALALGKTAPAFAGRAVDGRPVELRQLLKKGPAVLYFYRG